MRLSKLYIPASAFLCFGYPMTTVAATLAGLPVGQVNVLLKAVYASLFLLAIIGALFKPSIKFPTLAIPLFVFFIFYGIRLVFDLFILDVYAPLSSPIYVFTYFFLLTLMPAVSVALAFEPSDMRALNIWIANTLVLSAVSTLVLFQQSGGQFLIALAHERLELREEGEVMSQLNPIVIGSVGSALALTSIAQFSLNFKGNGRFRLLLSAVGLVLGLVVLLLAGSRGPLLAFMVSLALLVLGIFLTKMSRSSRQSRISKRSFILIVAMIIGFIFAVQRTDAMSLSLERLLTTFIQLDSGGHHETRSDLYSDALSQIAGSPFFGSGHLALNNTAYVHNSMLEAQMATGLFGGALFVGSLLIVVSQVWRTLSFRGDPLAFPLAPIVISMLVISQFSFSLSQSPEVWLLVFLFLTIASRTKSGASGLPRNIR